MGVLVGAEQPGGIVCHHAGLHIPGQKFPGVLLVTGGRGAVGHGHTLRGAVCVRVRGLARCFDLRRHLFERHGYDLVLLEGFKSSGWPKIEVVRREIADAPVSFQPLAVVGDIPGADFGLEDIQPLADWIIAQMPTL